MWRSLWRAHFKHSHTKYKETGLFSTDHDCEGSGHVPFMPSETGKAVSKWKTFPKDTTDHLFSVRGRENKLVSVPFLNMWKYFSSAEFTSRLQFLVSWDFFCISLIWVCCESCLTPNPFA